jgi:hypothetical protein
MHSNHKTNIGLLFSSAVKHKDTDDVQITVQKHVSDSFKEFGIICFMDFVCHPALLLVLLLLLMVVVVVVVMTMT